MTWLHVPLLAAPCAPVVVVYPRSLPLFVLTPVVISADLIAPRPASCRELLSAGSRASARPPERGHRSLFALAQAERRGNEGRTTIARDVDFARDAAGRACKVADPRPLEPAAFDRARARAC